jgi:hypothetical protein
MSFHGLHAGSLFFVSAVSARTFMAAVRNKDEGQSGLKH